MCFTLFYLPSIMSSSKYIGSSFIFYDDTLCMLVSALRIKTYKNRNKKLSIKGWQQESDYNMLLITYVLSLRLLNKKQVYLYCNICGNLFQISDFLLTHSRISLICWFISVLEKLCVSFPSYKNFNIYYQRLAII